LYGFVDEINVGAITNRPQFNLIVFYGFVDLTYDAVYLKFYNRLNFFCFFKVYMIIFCIKA